MDKDINDGLIESALNQITPPSAKQKVRDDLREKILPIAEDLQHDLSTNSGAPRLAEFNARLARRLKAIGMLRRSVGDITYPLELASIINKDQTDVARQSEATAMSALAAYERAIRALLETTKAVRGLPHMLYPGLGGPVTRLAHQCHALYFSQHEKIDREKLTHMAEFIYEAVTGIEYEMASQIKNVAVYHKASDPMVARTQEIRKLLPAASDSERQALQSEYDSLVAKLGQLLDKKKAPRPLS